jgi:hypothetical protein
VECGMSNAEFPTARPQESGGCRTRVKPNRIFNQNKSSIQTDLRLSRNMGATCFPRRGRMRRDSGSMPPSANPRNRRRRRTKTRILAIVGPSTNRGVEKKMQNAHSFCDRKSGIMGLWLRGYEEKCSMRNLQFRKVSGLAIRSEEHDTNKTHYILRYGGRVSGKWGHGLCGSMQDAARERFSL